MFGPEFAILKIPLPEEKNNRFCTQLDIDCVWTVDFYHKKYLIGCLIISDSDMLLENAGFLKHQPGIFFFWDTNRSKIL